VVPGRGNGQNLYKAAFVFLLTGDTSYADAVASELLAQIAVAGTDWTNSAKWCPYNGTQSQIFDSNAFNTLPWLFRLLFAYDYLLAGGYTGFTTQNKTDISNWFEAAGSLWDTVNTGTIVVNFMSGAYNTPPDFTCDGNCSGTEYLLYYGGPTAEFPQAGFSNRWSSTWAFSMATGIFTGNATLIRNATISFQATIRFGAYANGTIYDINRWRDCADATPCPNACWGHMAGMWGDLVGTADMLARTGDTSLYTYTSPGGLNGSGGSNVGLLKILQTCAELANKTLVLYGTSVAGSQNAAHQITWDSDSAGPAYWDFPSMLANIYYNDSTIHTAMTRNQTGTVNSCGDNQYGCFNGIYINYPDIPFMFGNMEGLVNPYV